MNISKDQKTILIMGGLSVIAAAIGTVLFILCDKDSSMADFLPHFIGSALGNIIICTLFFVGSKVPKK